MLTLDVGFSVRLRVRFTVRLGLGSGLGLGLGSRLDLGIGLGPRVKVMFSEKIKKINKKSFRDKVSEKLFLKIRI